MTISASTQAMTRSAISMPLQLRWFGFADTNCEIEKKAQFNFSSTLLIIYINFIHYIAIILYIYNKFMYILYICHVEIVCLDIRNVASSSCASVFIDDEIWDYMVLMCVRLMKAFFFCFLLLSFLRIIYLVMFFTSSFWCILN